MNVTAVSSKVLGNLNGFLSDDSIVIGVASDLEPEKSILYIDSQRSVVHADADGPVLADLLEVQGRVRGVSL